MPVVAGNVEILHRAQMGQDVYIYGIRTYQTYIIGARCARPTLVVKTENCLYVYIYICIYICLVRASLWHNRTTGIAAR